MLRIAFLWCIWGIGPAATRADTVVLAGKPPFRNVTVLDFRRETLVFRGVSGQVLRKPVGAIAQVAVDRCPALTAAEQAAAARDWESAVRAYTAAGAEAAPQWLADFIRYRQLRATQLAGDFAASVRGYVEMLSRGATDGFCLCAEAPLPSSDSTARAREFVAARLATERSSPARAKLRELLLDLALLANLTPLPPELLACDAAPVLASRPTRPLGILPADGAREDVHSVGDAPPRLPARSLCLLAARKAVEAGDLVQALQLAERALPYASEAGRPDWLVIRGRARLASGRVVEATDDFCAAGDQSQEAWARAEALYYEAQAREQLAQPGVAARLYEALLGRSDVPADWVERAKAARDRLDH